MIFYFGTRKSFATNRIYDFYLNCLFIWVRFFLRTRGRLLHFLEIVVGLFQMLTVSTIRFIHANNNLAVLLVHLIVVNWNRSSRRHIIVNNIRARKVHAKTLVVLPPPQWSEFLWNRLIFFFVTTPPYSVPTGIIIAGLRHTIPVHRASQGVFTEIIVTACSQPREIYFKRGGLTVVYGPIAIQRSRWRRWLV